MELKNLEMTIASTINQFKNCEKELIRQTEVVYNVVSILLNIFIGIKES